MKLNLYAPINNHLGYGIASINIAMQLAKLVDVSLFPIGGQVNLTEDRYNHDLQKLLDKQVEFDRRASCIKIFHQNLLYDMVGNGPRVGFPIFELDKFNKVELANLRSCDMLMVCSEWAKKVIYENNISVPTYVVPLGVDREIFSDKLENGQNRRTAYRFFNVGKWEYRKGHDILVEAFNKAFTKADDVELWVFPDNPFLNPQQTKEWVDLYKKSPLGDKVIIGKRYSSQAEMAATLARCDCGVYPSRAEGWNLDLLEAMSLEKEVIATNYSAHTEFINNQNCHLIQPNEIEEAYDGIWFHGQGNWMKFGDDEVEQLIDKMRYVYKKGPTYVKDNVLETARKYSWNNTAKHIVYALERENYAISEHRTV